MILIDTAVPSPGVYVFAEDQDWTQEDYLGCGKVGKRPVYNFWVAPLDGLGHYTIYGLCENSVTVPCACGLAEGCADAQRQRDKLLTSADVIPPDGSLVHALRREQDSLFPA